MTLNECRLKLIDDLELYAKVNLKIKTKNFKIKPLVFNKAQLYLHKKIEEQLATLGRVRVLVLKGRQQGISTYAQARKYHKVTNQRATNAFVLSHSAASANAIFQMTKLFYLESIPLLKPSCSKDNQKQLYFDKLNSGYKVGTAGTDSVGRAETVHLLHGSEVAYWQNGASIASGLLSTIPDADGTEIILESTSNGKGNFFYQQWKNAEKGLTDFIPIFIPWFWQDEYTADASDFEPTKDELELANVFKLTNEQLAWRRKQINKMAADGTDGFWSFKKEYPNTAAEAFETADSNSFIKDFHVTRAALSNDRVENEDDEIILGVDVARYGDDKTCMIFRQGNVAYGLKYYAKKSTMEIAGIIAKTLKTYPKIARVYVDVAEGSGVVDRLHELGFYNKVKAVNFGAGSSDSKYLNKRAQMWGEMREWFTRDNVRIPDDDLLKEDLVSLEYAYHSDSKLKLEKKELQKKRIGRSPDAGDALALTFANLGYDLSKLNLQYT
jgi:hypothetical protein